MTHRIVILGAGYAGLGAATRAARLLRPADVELTLVNRTDRFVERVRLHQLATGQPLPDRPLSAVLAGTGVRLVVAPVVGIDPGAGEVRLDGRDLRYDTLVYALGSGTAVDDVPGVGTHAFTVGDLDGAQRLRARLSALDPNGTVLVVGGGLTGLETATEIAEARPDLRVTLVCSGQFCGWLSERARRHVRRVFDRMGIEVLRDSRVTRVGGDGVVLDDTRRVPSDVVVWTAGFAVSGLATAAGLATDRRGRLLVDDRLRSTSHRNVYGVGDAAAAPTPDGRETRMSCQTGLPMGRYAAAEIARTHAGHRSKPIRIRYVWQNISLGRRDGVTQFTRSDDSPVQAVLTGRLSARFKEAITVSAAWLASR
ncbi:NAD(P)/FAD-dependent oxidoreductase [Pseudonocardia spinosispora]|uniref:NAD(P)/FAD-dependent oxidoreductase n=1 Tax=Pseudonocardia spinosispora TaxID=103441 RepID=UPI00040B30D8|nr:FAD-dependent oxidoreductase [Pseudonocardia spinosispora]